MPSGRGPDPRLFSHGRARLYTLLANLFWTKEKGKGGRPDQTELELLESLGLDPGAVDEFINMRLKVPLSREGTPTQTERSLYPQQLLGFYNHYGFDPSDLPADHPATMTAFMAQLVSREGHAMNSGGEKSLMELQRVESRFARTYLTKALRHLKDVRPCAFTEWAVELVDQDVALLHEEIVETSNPSIGEDRVNAHQVNRSDRP